MTLRVRLLAILVGLVVAGAGALIAMRVGDDEEVSRRGGTLTEVNRATEFSPIRSGQPQIPREIPGYASCARPGPRCAFVELTLARYAEIVGDDPAFYLHVDSDIQTCPRPEGPEEEVGAAPCRESAENLTTILVMRETAAARFTRTFGCGTPVVDPCR